LSLQAKELVYQDKEGIIRWTNNKERVAVFGANYCLPSACDYRAAAYVDGNRDDMIAEDLDHFKRMGWNGLRLCFWGDWQNTDREGNLIDNDHLRLFDKLIEEASKREIYMLLSPIVTYNSQWPEMNDTTNTGIMKYVGKADLILDPATKNAERNYINQLLNHRNRFTGRKIKDEPNILFVEIINEPSQ
jgi:aryl-phospho-beta-D-glucosidase BglC (GH1 family)